MIKGVPITGSLQSLQEYFSDLPKMSEFFIVLTRWVFLGVLIFYVCDKCVDKIRHIFLHK